MSSGQKAQSLIQAIIGFCPKARDLSKNPLFPYTDKTKGDVFGHLGRRLPFNGALQKIMDIISLA